MELLTRLMSSVLAAAEAHIWQIADMRHKSERRCCWLGELINLVQMFSSCYTASS